VAYVDVGAGPHTLVLVHGWASDHTVFRLQLAALAGRCRLLALDLPGHGESAPPARPYSMDLFADAVAAVMDDAGVERAVLVGHSNGTPVIRQVLRRHPERVEALVVVDGPLQWKADPAQVEAMLAAFRADTYRDTVGSFVDSLPGDGLSAELRASIRAMATAVPQEAVVGGLQAAADPALWNDDPIDVPLLMVLARQPAWDDAYEAWVRAHAPDVRYVVLDGVSHFLMLERPDAFDALLTEFVDGLP
jgi:pimeloyl-ACP methyl ester carboxylesterase